MLNIRGVRRVTIPLFVIENNMIRLLKISENVCVTSEKTATIKANNFICRSYDKYLNWKPLASMRFQLRLEDCGLSQQINLSEIKLTTKLLTTDEERSMQSSNSCRISS